MSRFTTWRRTLAVAAVLLLAGAGAAVAQEQTGSLFGTVTDTQGSRLPGVRVELTGIGAPRTVFTDAQGQFRFPNLDPGTYALSSSLEGFSTVEFPSVNIRVGRSTTLEIQLSPAVEEVITVTSESPLLDERKVDRGTTVSQIELEKIPTARDPWAIVTQTPGVLSDRINVGGNESGQQAVFAAPGTSDDENSFAVDGVVITDMAAIGASPTYYDFDQFEEIQVSTGGTDIEKVGAGASLNLVTKRGSNNPRGSARYLLTESGEQFGIFEQADADIQGELETGDGIGGCDSRNNPDCVQELAGTPGNSINEVIDFGFEAGGPIMRDKLWIWGSYGRNDIKQNAQTGDPDNTLLENTAIKLNGQLVSANSIVGSWNRGDKLKDGRRANAFVTLAASWNQDGPTEIWKLEDTHVFSSDFYLTGLYSFVDGGFQLQSKGAPYPSPNLDPNLESILDVDGFYHRSYYGGISDRNADNYQLDGSYFFNTGNLNHELKFGVSYRDFESVSNFGFPGRNLQHLTCQGLGSCGFDFPDNGGVVEDHIVIAWQAGAAPVAQTYTAGWIQDTLTAGNWTLNGGLRYDLQEGENLPANVEANPVFPEFLTAKNFSGNEPGFEWETISPRLGLTYALGAERKTLLRASYSRFAEQLQTGNITPVNPVGLSFVFAYYDDADGNKIFTDRDTDPHSIGFVFGSPTLTTVSEIDPSLDPSLTDELIFGVEHALLPEFVIGADVTWRLTTDLLDSRPFVIDETGAKRVATTADYEVFRTRFGGQDLNADGIPDVPLLPDGSGWSADFFGFRPGITGAGGNFLTNGDSEIEYLGGALTFTKRLSNRWMARGYLSYGDADFSFGSADRLHNNPTDAPTGSDGSASSPDGDLFVIQSAGSGPFENTFIQSSWSANFNGMYQVAPDRPWGFNVAGNLFAREGYPLLYSWDEPGPRRTGTVVAAATTSVDQFRADDLTSLDLRIEKDMRFTDNLSGILSLDAFNVTNENTIMSREVELDDVTANHVTQSLSPRIYRLGFRLNWR